MALRLSKDLKQSQTPSTSFDVSGKLGENYNLDEIEKQKSRTASDTELLAYVSNKQEQKTTGNIGIKETEERKTTNSVDYGSYLFGNEPMGPGYTPNITLRRPVVIWEDGTEQPPTEPDEMDTLFNSVSVNTEDIKAIRDTIEENNKNDNLIAERVKNLEEKPDYDDSGIRAELASSILEVKGLIGSKDNNSGIYEETKALDDELDDIEEFLNESIVENTIAPYISIIINFENCSVDVYKKGAQIEDSKKVSKKGTQIVNGERVYSRFSTCGLPTKTAGNGQLNIRVIPADGFIVDSSCFSSDISKAYKNLKTSETDGYEPNCYRFTKIKESFTLTITPKAI